MYNDFISNQIYHHKKYPEKDKAINYHGKAIQNLHNEKFPYGYDTYQYKNIAEYDRLIQEKSMKKRYPNEKNYFDKNYLPEIHNMPEDVKISFFF